MMLGKTQTFFLQYFYRESAFCGSLMTHKLPHKLPHKTDVGFFGTEIGFWNRYDR